jgi:hypothetical protein
MMRFRHLSHQNDSVPAALVEKPQGLKRMQKHNTAQRIKLFFYIRECSNTKKALILYLHEFRTYLIRNLNNKGSQ